MLDWANPIVIGWIIVAYLFLLGWLAWSVTRSSGHSQFFLAGRRSNWTVVAFGMIGATLSGITFTSIPGGVGGQGATPGFTYLQLVAGYVLGYLIIALFLLPVFYRLQLTSIYQFLRRRLGGVSSRTAAMAFLVSRLLISSLRLLLATSILHRFVFEPIGISFPVVVAGSLLVIWLYTFCGGIGTIIWTDVLQTVFMLLAAAVTLGSIAQTFGGWGPMISEIAASDLSRLLSGATASQNVQSVVCNVISGALLTICMTGLDQDMMQKNLTCRSIRQAQANMLAFAGLLVIVNVLFLTLGAALFLYAQAHSIELPVRSDLVFPAIAFGQLAGWVPLAFALGLIAATYSSADSTLTALTTSTCVDFLGIGESPESRGQVLLRFGIHLAFAVLTFALVLSFSHSQRAMIDRLLYTASYTYGPILALFSFGFFSRRRLREPWVPVICVAGPVATYLLAQQEFWIRWNPGYLVIGVNAALTFVGLCLIARPRGS